MKQRWMGQIFVGLGKLLLAGMVLAFVLATVTLWQPAWLFNERTLAYVLDHFGKGCFSWQDLKFAVSKPSLWRWHLRVSGQGLRYQCAGQSLAFGEFEASSLLNLHAGRNFLAELGPITLQQGDVVLAVGQGRGEDPAMGLSKDEKEAFFSLLLPYLPYLAETRFGAITVSLRRFKMLRPLPQASVLGEGRFFFTGLAPQKDGQAELELRLEAGHELKSLKAELSLLSFRNWQKLGEGGRLKFAALLQAQGALRGDVRWESRDSWLDNLQVAMVLRDKDRHLEAQGEGLRWGARRWEGSVKFALKRWAGYGLPVQVDACHWQILAAEEAKTAKARGEDAWQGDLTCQLATASQQAFGPSWLQLLSSLRGQLKFHGALNLSGEKEERTANMRASLAWSQKKAAPISLTAFMDFTGRLALADYRWHGYRLHLEMLPEVKEFQSLVQTLKGSPLTVPAPFNQLHGKAGCHIKGDLRAYIPLQALDYDCSLHLHAKQQLIAANSSGLLQWSAVSQGRPLPFIQGEVIVEGVDFVLPRLSLNQGLPKLFADKRIVLSREEEKGVRKELARASAPLPLAYDLYLKTRANGVIRLHNPLTKATLPLSLEARWRHDQPLAGKLSLENYRISWMRRQAHVQNFEVDLAKKSEGGREVRGKIIWQLHDYDIALHVLGSTVKPEYYFESKPPLSEREVLAVLLFGKQPEALDTGKLQSIEETQAAIADGAINLLSMYYLASTPVESVGYNPYTQEFSAKINLQPGLSLNVGGSTEGAGQIGFRKDLGKGWYVEVSAKNDLERRARKGVAMLKWTARY